MLRVLRSTSALKCPQILQNLNERKGEVKLIEQYILIPYTQKIIENEAIRTFLIKILIIMLAYSFTLALAKGVAYIWQKLFLIS